MRTEIERLVEDYAALRAALEDYKEQVRQIVVEMAQIERAADRLDPQLQMELEG